MSTLLLVAWLWLGASAESLTLTVSPLGAEVPLMGADPAGREIRVADLVRRIELAGIRVHLQRLPWERGRRLTEQDGCLAPLARLPEREHSYRWIGPIAYDNWVLFSRADTAAPASLEALRGERVGVQSGSGVARLLAERGVRLDQTSDDRNNVQKLLVGRFDFWASPGMRARHMIADAGLSSRIVPRLVLDRSALYIACSLDLDPTLLGRVGKALEQGGK